MKKALTFLITFALIISVILPVQGFALENIELENAISKAKSILDIGDGYDDFNYSLYKTNNETRYNLSWRDTHNKLGNVDVTIDSAGRIVSYYSYKPYDESSNHSKLPEISKADGLNIANAFIQKVNPSISGKLKYQENDETLNINDRYYYFNFIRIENDIPFYNNNVSVSVNNRTGQVQSYYCEWADSYTFPDPKGILDLEKAKEIYKDKLGLKLLYKLSYSEKATKPYLAYSLVYTNRSIDAKTGEVVSINSYYGSMYDMGGMGGANFAASEAAQEKGAALTPEEIKAVENSADFLDEKKVEEIARKTLNLDSGYRVESVNLYNSYMNKDDHVWDLYFVKHSGESQYTASVSIDAKTGDIINFYRSTPYNSNATVKYNREQALKIAKDFIKSLQPQKANDVEYTDWNNEELRPLNNNEKPREYYFTFTRLSNNVYFPGNGFNITVDTTQGMVTNYNFSWYKGELPNVEGVLTSDKAHEILFNTIGLEAQYVADYTNAAAKSASLPSIKPDIRLVYSIKPGKSVNIDGLTGKILDYSGKPYAERTAVEYTDIKGNKAENAIKILCQYGISLPGTEFKPDMAINQKDFLYLLAKSMNTYLDYDIINDTDDKLYNYLINMGILKENEKSPTSQVAKQDALKYIIRTLKYDHVADIKGIYTLSFLDKDKISPELYGYVAIGYGLNIAKDDGGYFKPDGIITRGDAAIMIYNLLNID